jgi:hypothetical protein
VASGASACLRRLLAAYLPPHRRSIRPARELEALLAQAQLARQPTTLIIAVTGGPGAGKTTLALRWAYSIRDRFPAGQLYADLRGYTDTPPRDPGEMIGEFLQAFSMPARQIPIRCRIR